MDISAKRSSEETISQFQQHVIPNYGRYPISLVRGEGSLVWDAERLLGRLHSKSSLHLQRAAWSRRGAARARAR